MAEADDATAAVVARVRRAQRQSERGLLLLSLGIIAASVLLTPSTEAVAVLGWEVPPLCLFTNLFGVECLGCGLTRSFTYMGHGDVENAFSLHRLGPVLYVVVLAQVPLRAWRLWKTRHST